MLRRIHQTLQIVWKRGVRKQMSFKTLAVTIRDVSSSQLKEKGLTFLLELLTPDLEEVAQQVDAYALLRAIVYRKFIVPEIYDLMDRVDEIMVTSRFSQVQEFCRSVLLQFMLEYPCAKNRLKLQFAFLIKNLSYVFESGRKPVLELLSVIIMKFSDDIIAEYENMLFVSLVLVIANDDSTKCREMASRLVQLLLERLGHEQQRAIVSHVLSWAVQQDNPALARVSLVFLHFHYLLSEYDKVAWPSVSSLFLHPHAWIRTASNRLFGTLFSLAPMRPPDEHLTDDFPLSLYGMRGLANIFSLQLESENLGEGLALQIVKKLFYVGKCFYAIPLPEADRGKKGMDAEDGSDGPDSKIEKDPDTNEITDDRSHPLPSQKSQCYCICM
ncbi:UTP20_5 [Sanghuangporus weigelae]